MGRNLFYKYEYENKICLPMIQTAFRKLVKKTSLETLKATCKEVHV